MTIYSARCEYCGNTVVYKNRQKFEHGIHHFCNRKCSGLWKLGKPHPKPKPKSFVRLVCSNCGQEFERRSNRNKKGIRFCSRECCGEWNKSHNSSKKLGVCKFCGKQMILKSGRKYFCNLECSSNWNREKLGIVGSSSSRYRKRHRRREILRKITMEITAAASRNETSKERKYIGCTSQFFRFYMESLFKPKMSWKKRSEWQVHHKVPLESFDLENHPELMSVAGHYSNCVPVWKEDHELLHHFRLVS